MQVGDERFNEDEINRLYDDGDYRAMAEDIHESKGQGSPLVGIGDASPPDRE
jgi:hypothetical protein